MAELCFKQRFSLRASTLLLIYVPVLYLVAVVVNALHGSLAIFMKPFFWASGQQLQVVMFFEIVFALAFFISSIVKRNPQLQFLIEVFIGICLFFFFPMY